MDLLRLFLVAGLLGHKLVWEVMRARVGTAAPRRNVQLPLPKRLLKLAKAAALVALVIQTLFLEVMPIANDPLLLQAAGLLLFVAGLSMAIAGRVQLGRNWSNLEDAQVGMGQNLVKHGIYQYIRHPIYAGDLLLLIGLELALNSWLVLGVLALAVFVNRQAAREERLLAHAFQGYHEYCRRTKRFIPFLV